MALVTFGVELASKKDMRTAVVILLLAAVVAAGAKEDRYKGLGERQLERFQKAKSNAQRLRAVRKACYYFKRAKATPERVRALNLETGVYYSRKSLSLAKKRNAAALKLAPKDKDALRLRDAIEKAAKKDIYESVNGIVSVNRVRSRRLAAGVPLRDRGVARRR